MMVLRVSDSEWKQQQEQEEERKNNQNQSLQRTQKASRSCQREVRRGEDLTYVSVNKTSRKASNPVREVEEEKIFTYVSVNRPAERLPDPVRESRGSGLAAVPGNCRPKGKPPEHPSPGEKGSDSGHGFHEKGRSLMKRRQFDDALCHLLQADQQFSKCGSTLLGSVDNFAVLQLDIVWCYRALEALSCLDDGRARLQRAEQSFVQCYGEQQQRLRMIKGSTGREEVLFLRLYLLQSLLAYIDGNDAQARQQLSKVEALYKRLSPDTEKMEQLMTLGFTEREARLGLRACEGDVQEAALHISNRRQERAEMKDRERQKRRSRLEAVSVLAELGFNRRDAARALQQSNGNVDQAYTILLNSSQAAEATTTILQRPWSRESGAALVPGL
uniref:Negative regulator of ubiquitin-like proteins 1 n=1 Tax=Neogobius melanostomus TaxID=47308 RepID=A0A8C6TF40_9GOBI